MIDFYKLINYQKECEATILTMCKINNLDFSIYKNLCRELGFQTKYKYREAVNIVNKCISQGKTYDDIVRIYNLKM